MRLQTLGLETFIWEHCNIRAKHFEVTHDYKNLIKTYTTVIYSSQQDIAILFTA